MADILFYSFRNLTWSYNHIKGRVSRHRVNMSLGEGGGI